MNDFTYEKTRRIIYGPEEEPGHGAHFIPVCEKCGRFAKADEIVEFNSDGLKNSPNADCKKCGRTQMIFEGWY